MTPIRTTDLDDDQLRADLLADLDEANAGPDPWAICDRRPTEPGS